MAFKCFVRIFKTSEKKIDKCFDKAIKQVYGGLNGIPRRTVIEKSEWNGVPQIEILGVGEDERCAFCNYFRQTIGEENTRRNNCPFDEL